MNQEIEKKYIIRSEEDVDSLLQLSDHVIFEHIEQNYLAVNDKEEVRIRKTISNNKEKETNYFLTYKNGSGLVRTEIETPISKQMYYKLASKVTTKPLMKTRHKVHYHGFILEIDSYVTKEYEKLFVLEVEFECVEDVTLFNELDIHSSLIRDVTEDKNYKNKNMWQFINK